jgi:hypothetical protein
VKISYKIITNECQLFDNYIAYTSNDAFSDLACFMSKHLYALLSEEPTALTLKKTHSPIYLLVIRYPKEVRQTILETIWNYFKSTS